MKKKLIIIVLLLIVGFVFGQVADEQGWRDFGVFTGLIDSTESNVQQVYNQIISLMSEKVEIMDDANRLAELTKILDVHPDHSVASLTTQYQALVTLKTWLFDNGYVNQ